jgi:hypothetical protein
LTAQFSCSYLVNARTGFGVLRVDPGMVSQPVIGSDLAVCAARVVLSSHLWWSCAIYCAEFPVLSVVPYGDDGFLIGVEDNSAGVLLAGVLHTEPVVW